MQVMMHDIRRWGSQKIFTEACKNSDWLTRIKLQDKDKKSPAFSIPKQYVSGEIQITDAAKKVLMYCEPMINNGIEVTKNLQRKFRNTWSGIWKNFALDNNLSEYDELCLAEYGLSSLSGDIDEIYCIIVDWYLFTSSESNLQNNNLDKRDIITKMIISDSNDFTYNIVRELKY